MQGKSFAFLLAIFFIKNIVEAEMFRKYFDNVCNSFDVRSINFVQTKFECITSCVGECAGVSYDTKSKECVTRKCQLKKNVFQIENEKKCYMKENDLCTRNVDSHPLNLLSQKSSTVLSTKNNCLVIPAGSNTTFGIDLEAQYMISGVNLNVQNLILAYFRFKSALFYPIDPAIDLLKYSADCGSNRIESNGENVIIGADCSPCSVHSRYLLFDFDVLQTKSEGDVLLCGVNVTGCSTGAI